MSETAATPSLALFDPSATAHSGNALRGLARAAQGAHVRTTVYAHPSVAIDATLSDVTWETLSGPRELMEPKARREHRAVLIEGFARDGGASDVFCDLGLDRTIGSRGARIPASDRTVFVCHRAGALDFVPRRWRRKVQMIRVRNRVVLRGLGRSGARFIVHTDAVAERLADFVPSEQITTLGWAVVARDTSSLQPDWMPTAHDRMVLFAGSLRAEKGLGSFLHAAVTVSEFDRLVIPGRIPDMYRHLIPSDEPRLQTLDRWLDEDDYRQLFSDASLVVLPYEGKYTDRGTMSSVLLEAMACGRPLLVSRAIAHLLPPGYEGAVVAESTDPESMAAGLRRALNELDALERAAMDTGRRHIATHHTFEDYLKGVLGAPVRP